MTKLQRWGGLYPAILVFVLGLAAIGLVGEAPSQQTVAVIFVAMTFGLSWNIIGGYAGQGSFGHAAYFGIGAYMTTLLAVHFQIPPIAGVWLGMAVAVIAALIIGAVTFRLTGIYFGLSTVVFPIILSTLATYFEFQEVPFPYRPDQGILYFAPSEPQLLSLLALLLLIVTVAVVTAVERSRFGLYLRALRSDQGAAEASGLDTTVYKVLALVLSASLAGAAGALYGAATLVLTPEGVFGLAVSVQPVIFTLFGGIGTLWGPIIGAGLLLPLTHYLDISLGGKFPGISSVIYGAALLTVVLAFPQGVYWGIRNVLKKRRRKGHPAAAETEPAPEAVAPVVPVPVRQPERLQPAVGERTVLQIDHIRKSFGGLHVLTDVSFSVREGEIVGVMGPNGAGKTTLFNIISGFISADGGQILVDGKKVTGLKPHQVFGCGVGRTFQIIREFKQLTLFENVLVPALIHAGTQQKAREAVKQALAEVELTDRALVMVDELSTGELRRMELARSIAGGAKLLLLDEFLGGLGGQDAQLLLDVIRRVRARGLTIVAIEHTMHAMVALVDRFVVLNFGEIIATGKANEVAEDPVVIEAYLGKRWLERVSG